MYRSWAGLAASGLLAGVAAVALFAGFGTPWLLAVAVLSGVGSYLAYRYAADRMVQSVYAGVGDPDVTDSGAAAVDGQVGTAEAVDSTTAASSPGDGEYDEWTWADVAADDPFWSDDEDDWEDPWEANTTDPSEASTGDWRKRRGTGDGSDRGRWWEERDDPQGRRDGGGGAAGVSGGDWEHGRWWEGMGEEGAAGDAEEGPGDPETAADRTAAAYAVLGLEPGAGPEAVRAAYRERVKEAHPDTPGGGVEEFIRVREAYEYLRERLSGTERHAE
ncbi:J domain-containing protein [Salinirubellus salinus]|uniref:J domain-containing protein n=1 Tax=Salinirubellus salinus TaxID=1364945 RepID=A0A9E7R0S7_9EURY|nr:J domain-containing protein [Salinirubellus salinus]UWM53199.1 J domain-containing protein [Salinirubellus salinus]